MLVHVLMLFDSLKSTDGLMVMFGGVGVRLSCRIYDFVKNDVIVTMDSNFDVILKRLSQN